MSEEKQAIREQFRKAVLERDGHRCVLCGRSDLPLDVHHVIPRKLMPGGGYVVENGATLCAVGGERGQPSCHERAEEQLEAIASGRAVTGWASPERIFEAIGSHWLHALTAAKAGAP